MPLQDILHHLIRDTEHIQNLLNALLAHPSTRTKTLDWARATMEKTYISEVASLSHQEHGLHRLHYIVGAITEEKLRSFDINTIMVSFLFSKKRNFILTLYTVAFAFSLLI